MYRIAEESSTSYSGVSFLSGLFLLKANLTFNKRVLDAHRWHMNKLEQLQRKLNNETRHGRVGSLKIHDGRVLKQGQGCVFGDRT